MVELAGASVPCDRRALLSGLAAGYVIASPRRQPPLRTPRFAS